MASHSKQLHFFCRKRVIESGAEAAGGGIIGQVVFAGRTTTASVAGGAATVFSASITPAAATSKFLVQVNAKLASDGGDWVSALLLKRNGTAIAHGDAAGNRTRVATAVLTNGAYDMQNVVVQWLDEPATAAALTYDVQIFSHHPTNPVYLNRHRSDEDASYVSRSASSITVWEILPAS